MSEEDTAIYRQRSAEFLAPYLRSGLRLLDVACGFGSLCEVLPPGIVYRGIDLVPEFIEEARRSYSGPNRTFEVVDLSVRGVLDNLPDDGFDLAVGRWMEATVGAALPEGRWPELVGELLRITPLLLLWSPGHTSPKVLGRGDGSRPIVISIGVDGPWSVPKES